DRGPMVHRQGQKPVHCLVDMGEALVDPGEALVDPGEALVEHLLDPVEPFVVCGHAPSMPRGCDGFARDYRSRVISGGLRGWAPMAGRWAASGAVRKLAPSQTLVAKYWLGRRLRALTGSSRK